MSPTLRHVPVAFELDAVTPVRTPRRARCYAVAVLGLALVLVGALVLGGAPLPTPGLLLVLALPLALCMNRYLLFPNEVGVTADAAVIFTAMVAFRGDAQWLGPLVLALLVGPLDARHWGARAFTRMAYNSGSTALVTAASLAVFVSLMHAFGTGWAATLVAAAIAAVPYVASESVLGVALVTLLGERPAAAVRHQLPLNAIVLPLAVAGAATGLAALGIGWWCALVLLLPIPVVPELVLVVLPRRVGARTTVELGIATVGAGLVALSVAVADPAANLATGVVGLACLALVECPPRRSRPLPPLGLVPVGAVVALCLEAPPLTVVFLAGAAGAGHLVVGACWDRRAWWSLALGALVAALGAAVAGTGSLRVAALTASLLVALVVAFAWGPLPWSSRGLGRVTAPRVAAIRLPSLVVVAIGAPVLTAVAVATHGDVRTTAALVALALTELGVFAVALAVRLWRFAPRRRAVDLVVLASIGTTALVVAAPLAEHGVPLAVAVTVVVVAALVCVARPFTKLSGTRSNRGDEIGSGLRRGRTIGR